MASKLEDGDFSVVTLTLTLENGGLVVIAALPAMGSTVAVGFFSRGSGLIIALEFCAAGLSGESGRAGDSTGDCRVRKRMTKATITTVSAAKM